MSRLDELEQKFSAEVSFNKFEQGLDLHVESLKTNDFLVSWISLFVKEKRLLKKLYIRKNKLIQALKIYYSGKASPDVYHEKPLGDRILRTELDSYIQADDEYLKLKEEIDEQESVVELCERAVDALKTRAFLIKDAIKYLEFINGL